MGLIDVDAPFPARKMTSCSNTCGSRQAQADTEGGYQRRYGVRSYLHQFYEDCTASIWEYEDDFQIQRSPNRWSSVFWKVRNQQLKNIYIGCGKYQSYRELRLCASISVTLNALLLPWKGDYKFGVKESL